MAGCAPRPVAVEEPAAPADFPHHTAQQIVDAVHSTAADDGLRAFSSQPRISVRSPRMNADGTAIIRQRVADTLWASLRGPLNIEVMRALVTPDSFFVHDRLQNRLVVGPAEAAQQLFPGPVGVEEIFRALTGTVIPDRNQRWFANASTLDGTPIYWLTAADVSARMAVDPTTWRVRRYERLTASGQVVDRRLFEAFESVEGRVLPQRIELGNPAEETFLTIEHRRLTLNPEGLAFPFDPRGAAVVSLTEFSQAD